MNPASEVTAAPVAESVQRPDLAGSTSCGGVHEPGSDRHLCMPVVSRKSALRRLAIAKGHLESIQRMLEADDVYCVDVLKQLKAVQGALVGAGEVVLRGHLESHVATAASRGDTTEIVDELMRVLKYT